MTITAVTSRVGRKPVSLPKGVDIKVNGTDLIIKGPKGESKFHLDPLVEVQVENNELTVKYNSVKRHIRTGTGSKRRRSIAGTVRSRIDSIIRGVTTGFERKLVLVGVGYRAQAKGKVLGLTLGFSHPVDFPIPAGITVETPSQTEIIIKGIDKHLVGHTASKIRAIRCPEPYKGKGVRYADEIISLKETKKK